MIGSLRSSTWSWCPALPLWRWNFFPTTKFSEIISKKLTSWQSRNYSATQILGPYVPFYWA